MKAPAKPFIYRRHCEAGWPPCAGCGEHVGTWGWRFDRAESGPVWCECAAKIGVPK